MPTDIATSLWHAATALLESLPCGPRARAPSDDATGIELERRTSEHTEPPPRQSLSELEKNMRRMRLKQNNQGVLKLKQLKIGDPNSSRRPEQEAARRTEDSPLRASELRDRLDTLAPDTPLGERQFLLTESHDVKGLGFNVGNNRPVATTGTSMPNVLCVTDGMGPCIAVAMGAEKIAHDGTTRLPGAKARVFHVAPTSTDPKGALKRRVEGYQKEGLTVTAAMHGGWHFNEFQAERIRSALADLGVTLAFDESCEKRGNRNTPLGAVVQDDHTVRFVTSVAVREHQEPKDSPASSSS